MSHPTSLTPFELALVAHLVADWLLQNDWMAEHKGSLKHPAAWVHAIIHALLLGIALNWQAGLVLGSLHLLIDTRILLLWWMRSFGKSTQGAMGMHIMIWSDQVLHIWCLVVYLLCFPIDFPQSIAGYTTATDLHQGW